MIKYGIHCYVLTDGWSDSRLDLLDTAAGLGAEAFEVVVGDDIRFTPALTRRRAEALGMTLTVGPGGAWPADCDLSADDPADRQRGLAWHQKQIDVCAELGAAAYTGAMYGHPGVVQRRLPPPGEFGRMVEGMHALAEYAAARGVAVAVEPMSHFRTHLINTPEQVLRLLAAADHPNLWVLLDTYHMVTEVRDYGQAVRATRGRLFALHACENDRGVPGGGLVPWAEIFSALRDIDFDGIIMLEAYNSSLGDFALRRGMFHNVCPDGEAFARQGLSFVRNGMASVGM